MAESEISSQASNTTASKKAATAGTVKSLIYVGPNIAREGLNRFKVYQNGTPTHFDDVFDACPAVKKLFVEVEKLSEILIQIGQTGSAYHTWYDEATKYVKGA